MDLHLWKLVLNSRAVADFAYSQRLLHRDTDDGYVMHAVLAAVFGEMQPGPFVFERVLTPSVLATERPSAVSDDVVLAYASRSLDSARERSDGAHGDLVRWSESKSRLVPAIAVDTRLAFSTRVLPIVRSRAASEGRPQHGRGHGRELDAFVAECARVGPSTYVDRADVYRRWLAERMSPQGDSPFGGAELEDFSLQAFRRVKLLRKEGANGGRRPRHVLERPDALVTGTLRVTHEAAFRALLARGIGRHRAFGFGMLLIRRV